MKVVRTDSGKKERIYLAAKDCVTALTARGFSSTGLNTHSLPKMIASLHVTFYLITLSLHNSSTAQNNLLLVHRDFLWIPQDFL